MLTLILVRHGETLENIQGLMQGQSLGTLSDSGRAQIQALGRRLKSVSIDLILSSDLPRSVETTTAIAEHHDCKIEYLPALRERSSGIFEGQKNEDYRTATLSSHESPEHFRPERGESIVDLDRRVASVLHYAFSLPRPITVLISSHSGPINCMICQLQGKPLSEFWNIKLSNACVNTFTFGTDGSLSDSILNCTHHLMSA